MNNHIRALEATQTPSVNSINPLIEGTETADNVRCALSFLADAVSAIGNGGNFSPETTTGMALLLETCAAALKINPNSTDTEEGVAA